MKSIILIGCLILAIFIGCSDVQTSKSVGLTIEQTLIGTYGESGTINPVEKAEFQKGDAFSFVLMNVSGFKKGANGLNKFDMDVSVFDPDGNKVYEKKELLNGGYEADLPNNVSASSSVDFTIGPDYPAGKYKMTVDIYDKIGTGRASASRNFVVL